MGGGCGTSNSSGVDVCRGVGHARKDYVRCKTWKKREMRKMVFIYAACTGPMGRRGRPRREQCVEKRMLRRKEMLVQEYTDRPL